MTYAEILADVKRMFGGTTVADVHFPTSGGTLQACILEGLNKVAERIDPSRETFLVPRKATITGDGTTTEWDIPTIITTTYEFMRAKQVVIGDHVVTHTRFRIATQVDSTELEDSDNPVVFISGQKLNIYPALAVGDVAYLHYLAYPGNTAATASGTGVGTLSTLTDTSKTWPTDAWIGGILTAFGGANYAVTDSGLTTLTVVGTPASGAYTLIGPTYPNVGLVHPAYHKAISLYAFWQAGYANDGPWRWNPQEAEVAFEKSFREADKGQNEGFADKTDTMKDIYMAEVDDTL
jgi:hypothetical protein